jgi:hypothetical protein
MPERSKGDDLRSSVFVLVGSNPTHSKLPCSVMVIIAAFHAADPGSIPGMEKIL